ncbi:MAG: TetR/AcrR family transcriptional regulator, partial [Acidimicrobiia bacterium]|nr:TetR/AcrR family transcriptional regulator [Acidimicrobiia bacterium]
MLNLVGDPTTKERIVAEARRSFADHGYEGASLNDIAEGVGIRRPSLLHYFPSKEAMYRHVLEEALLEWSRQIDRARSTEVDGWKVVDRILEVSFEF